MKIRPSAVLFGLWLVASFVPAAAADHMPLGLGHADCSAEASRCNASGDPVADAVDGASAAVGPVVKKPDLLDRVASFLAGTASGVAGAASSAAHAVAAALAALGAALWGALRSWSEFLLSFRPAAMPLDAFAGVAAASTAVAAAGVQVGSWIAWRKLAPYLALLPGFSRIAKDELLDHERRSRIHEMIRHSPGIRLSEISRGLELSWGSCLHHLRKLRADRLITFKVVGRHKCYFLNGSGLSDVEMQAASLLQGPTLQGIAAYLRAHPHVSLKELAQGIGISSPLAAFHVAKLERAGLLQKVRDGRAVRLALAEGLPGEPVMPSSGPVGFAAA